MDTGIWSILPVVLVVTLSLWTKKVHLALLSGILAAALLLIFQNTSVESEELPAKLYELVKKPIFSSSHFGIIIFTTAIAASINLLSKNGSLTALIFKLGSKANGRKKTMLATYFLGLLIFFDDYTNSLLIGNLMKKQFDRFKISREKLAYIIDSTSAPVASLAIISTWIGFELGEIDKAMSVISTQNETLIPENAYLIFMNSLPYSYYTILTLITVFVVIWFGKDFGPMRRFEEAAKKSNFTEEDIETSGASSPVYVAIISLSAFLIITTCFLFYSGYEASPKHLPFNWHTLKTWLGAAETTNGIVWGASSAFFLSFFLSLKKFGPKQLFQWTMQSLANILSPLAILYLAWIFSEFINELHLVDFVRQILFSNQFDSRLFPTLIFVASAIISFSTGSSWGTMSILFPLCIPIAYELAFGGPSVSSEILFYSSIASVLSGAVWGDHCSPLSDTTIISSISADCNHINHVKSQLPYAILTGIVSITGGLIPINFGFSNFLLFTVSTAVIILIFNMLPPRFQKLSRQ